MMLRIGLGVASDSVRAVGVRGATVVWAVEAERVLDEDLSVAIVQLLRHATLPRWPRPVVVAAIGPAASQTKRLIGLPVTADAATMRAIIREGTSRFFLRNGIPLVTAGVRIDEPGTAWATAFDLPVVNEIEAACRTLGLRIRLIVPSIVALPRAVEAGEIEWMDGDVHNGLTIGDQRLLSTRRLSATRRDPPESGATPRALEALHVLGANAWRYADAYGATQLSNDEPLALRSSSGELDAGASRRAVRVAAVCLCLAALSAIGTPIVARVVRAHRTARQLLAISGRARDAEAAERDLARMSAALAEVSSFDASRRSPTLILSQLTRALPDNAALVTMRMDSAGGTIVILAPRAAAALAALDSVKAVVAPEIIGPVTKEMVGSRELERATVQFRFGAPQAHKQ
ncbi:MAG TPA: hypothetical protein VGO46_00735 [Gemmatimonadaceae bacterium]|nr:hypothetical protein [Gemmatimonadaceae bacterium]